MDNKKVILTAAVIAALGTSSVMGADIYTNVVNSGTDNTVLNANSATVSYGAMNRNDSFATSVGTDNTVGTSSVVVGRYNKTDNDSIAIGGDNKFPDNHVDRNTSGYNIGIGNQVTIDSTYSIAMGRAASITTEPDASIHYGDNIAIGREAIIKNSTSAIALGAQAEASTGNVAIGFATKALGTPDAVDPNNEFKFLNYEAKRDSSTMVAFGWRQLKGVMPGKLSDDSKDGVNGAQLYGVAKEAMRHTTVKTDDSNIVLNKSTNEDNGNDYNVALNKNLKHIESAQLVDENRPNEIMDIAPSVINLTDKYHLDNGIRHETQIFNNSGNSGFVTSERKVTPTSEWSTKAVGVTLNYVTMGNNRIENVGEAKQLTDALTLGQFEDGIKSTDNSIKMTAIKPEDGKGFYDKFDLSVAKNLKDMSTINFTTKKFDWSNYEEGVTDEDAPKSEISSTNVSFYNNKQNEGSALTSHSLEMNTNNGNSSLDSTGLTVTNGNDGNVATIGANGFATETRDGRHLEFSSDNVTVGGQQIHDVAAGTEDTDAVNVKQLKDYFNDNRTIVSAGDDNIKVTEDNGNFIVSSSSTPKYNSVSLDDGNNESSYTTKGVNMIYRDGDNSTEYHTGYNYDGVHIRTNDGDANLTNEVSLTDKGLNNGGNRITNVSKGVKNTDAVNVEQLEEHTNTLNKRIDNISNAATDRANHYTDLQTAKVGARAAAMANLHYQDFNADDKWSFAAGYGHYKGQNAGALGIAYQPNENTMITASTTIGNDTMFGAGVSMKFGKSAKMNANKQVAMAKEIQELREIVAAQNEKINMLIDHAMGRDEAITDTVFPDVPENHWAYMMVQDLAYKGIVSGYPDGSYKGDRVLTRYEFAVALDRAISAGYMNPELGRAIKEFKPELDSIYANMRFRVDRQSGKDGSVNKVERVRVNKDNTRDNYGTIVK